jgi:hypothetical protein
LKSGGTTFMASAGREPILGVWPPMGPGVKPLVRGSGDEALLKLTEFSNSDTEFAIKIISNW